MRLPSIQTKRPYFKQVMAIKGQPFRRQKILEAVAIVVVVTLLVMGGVVTLNAFSRLQENRERVRLTNDLLFALESTESVVKDAETGQRGFIITGEESYLEPYDVAIKQIPNELSQLEELTEGDLDQQPKVPRLRELINEQLMELDVAISIRRQGGLEAGKAVVDTDVGQRTMDQIRDHIADMRRIAEATLATRSEIAALSYRQGRWTAIAVTFIGFALVAGLLFLIERNRRLDTQMRWFVEQVQDYAIFTMDANRKATSWNRGVEKMLGYTAEEFIGADILQLLFPQDAIEDGSAEAEFRTAELEGTANDDRWMLRKDGQQFWASGATNTILNEQGKVVGFSKVMRDLTDRQRAQDEMAELASKLSESDRRKDEFLAVLAHELRNPLAPIKHAIELMGMNRLDSENEELRQVMDRQSDQMVHLIDDLLDISRISRGKIDLRKSTVDLHSIVLSSVESCRARISTNGQRIDVASEPGAVFVHGDPGRLTQIVSNLLTNACKYSGEGAHIRLIVEASEINGSKWAVIRVADNGIGIAEDKLEAIFDMFEQVDDSLERGQAGLGIGLTLVRTLVELHGGKVTAKSEGVGKGSEFVVQIPQSESKALPPAELSDSPVPSTRPFRILVVEDQRALRVILTQLLTKLGHQVEVAESGTDALDALNGFSPEIIFSDISMPGMTGYELVRRLRARKDMKDVVIIAMTGYGQTDDRIRAIESGFDDHLVKPVDIRVLKRTLASIQNSRDKRA